MRRLIAEFTITIAANYMSHDSSYFLVPKGRAFFVFLRTPIFGRSVGLGLQRCHSVLKKYRCQIALRVGAGATLLLTYRLTY